jgi:RHS repeat-associated protein
MRIKKNAPAGITLFPFKGYEIDPNGVATKFILIGSETLASKRGANKYFYHNDHLGGVHVITDSAGNQVQLSEYDPWGVVSKQVGNIDPTHRFTGQELDPETGFHYYGGRYYDQDISRFVSPDPYVQEPDLPQNLNRYSYVLNNPQSLVDPSGHFWEWIVAAFLAVIEAAGAEAATTEILATLAGKLVAISFVASIEQLPIKALNQAELHRQILSQQPSSVQQARPSPRREELGFDGDSVQTAFNNSLDGDVIEVNKAALIGRLLQTILRGIQKGVGKGGETWRTTKAPRPLSKMGHAQKHLPDFKKIDPNITSDEVAQILEHVRKTGTRIPNAGSHGEIVYEKVIEIAGKQTLVRVIESAGGVIKSGYPVH